MDNFFDKENALFMRAVKGDLSARDQLILDNLHVAKQVAYDMMRGKVMTDEEKEDELQEANAILIQTIDAMIKNGKMYNVNYLRINIKNKLISYYRKDKYGVYDNSYKDDAKKDELLRFKNALSIDDDLCYNVPYDYDMEECAANKMMVDELLKTLNDEEKQIIKLMFYHRLNQGEIAARLGIKQCTVSVKYKSILKKLRNI